MEFRDGLLLLEYLSQYCGIQDAHLVYASNGQVQGLAVKVPWSDRVFFTPADAIVGLVGFHQVNGQLDVVNQLPAKHLNESVAVKPAASSSSGK